MAKFTTMRLPTGTRDRLALVRDEVRALGLGEVLHDALAWLLDAHEGTLKDYLAIPRARIRGAVRQAAGACVAMAMDEAAATASAGAGVLLDPDALWQELGTTPDGRSRQFVALARARQRIERATGLPMDEAAWNMARTWNRPTDQSDEGEPHDETAKAQD